MKYEYASLGVMLAAAIYSGAYAKRSLTLHLAHFKPSEFGVWWPLMNHDLLIALDEFRARLGAPVEISKATGALGRPNAERAGSQHRPTPFVNAVDVMIPEAVTLRRAYRVARDVNKFSGIGLYPDWQPKHGLHLDVRADRTAANPATWSAFRTADGGQQYTSIDRALV